MLIKKKSFHFIIILILCIHSVIGTPFSISLANEIVESSVIVENIEPVENTVMAQDTIVNYPVNDVSVTENNTTITYTESNDSSTTDTTPTIITNTTENQEIQTIITDTNTTITYIENEGDTTSSDVSTLSDQTKEDSDITTAIVSENNISLSQSSLTTSVPQKSVVFSGGLIDPLTIDSYNIIDENSDMTFCSYVSYLNLKYITTLSDESLFMRGDAIDIWNNLTFQATLSGHAEVIFTGTNLSGQQFIEYLSGIYTTSGSSLFDIVTFRPKTQDDQKVDLSLMQFHRFVIFLGSDLERYVLDPIRMDSSDPILLTSYLTEHIVDDEEIKIIESYTLTDTVIEDEKESLLTTGDIQKDGIVVHSPMEFLPYVLQGLITSTESGSAITNEVIFHTGFRYETVDGSLSAFIPAGLIIKTADGENFNPFVFNINTLSGDNELSGNYNDNFQFGISGQHLIFSQPIQITVQTPEYSDGVQLDLLVQHEGQDWNKQGLTNNSNAQCISDGSVSQEDQGQTTQVQSGQVIFYTCGASSFALGYVPAIDLPNNTVNTFIEQSDGKVIVGGVFTGVGGVIRNRVARLNTDKSLDTSYNPDVNGQVNSIALQSDGKLIVGGTFTTVGGTARNNIARINTDGSLDTSFNPNANNTVNTIAIQTGGQVILGGTFTTMSGTARNRIARINTDGSLDTSFDPNANNTVNTISIQTGGNILLGGDFTTIVGTARNRIARVSSTGLLDTTFNPNSNGTVNTVALQTGGQVILGGNFSNVGGTARNFIARVSSTGLLDTTFNPNANGIISSISLQTNGNILVGGNFTTMSGTARNRIARVSSTGLLDTTFNPNSNGVVSTIQTQSNGNILLGGAFTTIGGLSQSFLAYFNDGIIDTLYNVRPNGLVNIIQTQTDGEIILGGAFTTVGGVTRNRIARINTNGSLDTSFDPNANNTVNTIAIQTGGQVILGGTFTTMSGTARNRIARVSSTGLLDTTFNPNANGTVSTVAIQTGGQVILGGTFTTVGGTARNNIARVSSTGLLDTTFNPNANGTVNSIVIQPNGQVILGGTFTTVGGTARNRIARVSSTGLLDTTFNPNANNTVNAISLQTGGQVLFGGSFTSLGGSARNFMGRVSSTGLLDTTFIPVLNNTVFALYLSSSGEIFAGGNFTAAGGVPRTQLAKILSNGTTDYNLDVGFSSGTQINTINMDNENNLLVGGSFTSIDGNINSPYFSWIGTNNYVDFTQSVFWADAGVGTNCSINNCAISKWTEKAFGQSGTQTTGANQPVYISTGMNFNPTIQFAGTPTAAGNVSFDYINYGRQSLNITNKMTVFVVQNLDIAGEHYSIGLQQSGAAQRSYSNVKLNSSKGTSITTTGPIASSYIGSLSIDDTIATHYINGSRVTNNTITAGNMLSGNNLWVGGVTSTGTFSTDGNIGEIIIYNKILTGILRNQIESYLGLKYAITLDQSLDGDGDSIAGTSYRNGSGIIIRDAFINSGYKNNIIGLGSDSMTSLDQRVSKSVSTGDIITIATTPDFVSANQNNERISLDNNSYVIMGHNGASTGFTASYSGGSNNRMSRIWRVESTNMSTGIYIGGIANGMLGMNTNYAVVASADTTFTNADIIENLILSGGYLHSNITIPDGYYFTFAKTIDGDLCIDGSTGFDMGSITASVSSQIIETESNDYFQVDDQKGGNSGYYTTLSISPLTGLGGSIIPTSAIQIKADPIVKIGGYDNPSVVLDSNISAYTTAGSPKLFMQRALGSGTNILGTYGSKVRLRINIPAYQAVGTYSGNITYTLYEN